MLKIGSRSIWLNELMSAVCELLIAVRRNHILSSLVHVLLLLSSLTKNVLTDDVGVDSLWDRGELMFVSLGLVVDEFIHDVHCRSVLDGSLAIEDLCVGIGVSTVEHTKDRERALMLGGSV
jgi:hypothetical protein